MKLNQLEKSKGISVIIVTYNSENYIVNCINSLFRYQFTFGFEIIIIDNNSTDKTLEVLKSLNENINLISNRSNLGFAFACNQGIKASKFEYVFLLNPDSAVLNNAIEFFYNFMEKPENENVWCCGGQLFNDEGKMIKSMGKFPSLWDVFLEQFGIKGVLLKISNNKSMRETNLKSEINDVPFVLGCDMFIRKKVLEKIGLFNKSFFLNFEETELSCRAKKAGYRSILVKNAKIIHHSRKSFVSKASYMNNLWNGQLLYFKLTKSHITFLIAKYLHHFGAFVRLVIKNDREQLARIDKIKTIQWAK